MSKLYYRPSGNMPPRVVITALVASIALMPIAWVYAWLNHFAPAGLNLLYAIGFGGCCARAAFLSAKWGRARNPGGMALVGAGIGLIAWYCQWVAWLSIACDTPAVAALINDTGRTMIDFAIAPGRMDVLAGQIKEAQLIELKSPDFAWILEFLFVTALSARCSDMAKRSRHSAKSVASGAKQFSCPESTPLLPMKQNS